MIHFMYTHGLFCCLWNTQIFLWSSSLYERAFGISIWSRFRVSVCRYSVMNGEIDGGAVVKVFDCGVESLVQFSDRAQTLLPLLLTSVRKFGCLSTRDNHKCHRTTKNTNVVVRRTTINCYAPAVKLDPHLPCFKYGQPKTWTDNQKMSPGCPWDNHLFFLNSNTAAHSISASDWLGSYYGQ